jgi:hypothetical protein
MTTTANELGEREEKGKQNKKTEGDTEGETDWTWIFTNEMIQQV